MTLGASRVRRSARPGALFRNQNDFFATETHPLPDPQLGTFATFDLAIDLDLARLHHGVRSAARADQTDRFQELVKLNVIAAHGKGNRHRSLHYDGLVRMPPKPPKHALMSECRHCRLPHLVMTSFHATAPLDCRSQALLDLSEQTIRNALATGALQPISTESTVLTDGDFSFSVRWVSSLALKDRARVATVSERRPDFNPFLPPEPALTVARLGNAHSVLLNKFPVIDHHLLIVTRAFEAQTAPLTLSDFCALATVLVTQGGLGFYNGGGIAGASQPHKHLQWVPDAALRADDGFAAFSQGLRTDIVDAAQANPALPWRHAFVSLAGTAWCDPKTAGETLLAAFTRACIALDLSATANPMPPYNLLVSRDWMLVVPRRREKWQDVSINALGYAGSLFVRSPEQIERLRAEGPLAVLGAVGFPR